MRVLHIVEDFSTSNTGITASVSEITALSLRLGIDAKVVAPVEHRQSQSADERQLSLPLATFGRQWRRSALLQQCLVDAATTGTVGHIHGVWMHPQWMAARVYGRRQQPFVLSPHNMLGGWLWRHSRLKHLKKAAYWRYIAYPVLRHADVIHALSDFERDTLRDGFFESQRIEVIPNPIDVSRFDSHSAGKNVDTETPYFLFLGRLHPVKGLELLVDAFARLSGAHELWIAGAATDVAYETALRQRVQYLPSKRKIRFLGPISGEQKWRLLKGAWCLCAPSYSEGSSMAVLEALACATPVVATRSAGPSDAQRAGGYLVTPHVDDIERALSEAANWTLDERLKRGALARAYARDTYAHEVVGPRYLAMYRSIGVS